MVEATPGAKRRPVGVRTRRPQKFCQTFSGFWITRPLSFPKADEKIQVAQKYNFHRYHYQGIARYEPSDVVQARPCRFTDLSTTDFSSSRSRPALTRASMGLWRIYFYKVDTPLRKFFAPHANLIRHCNAVHTNVIKN